MNNYFGLMEFHISNVKIASRVFEDNESIFTLKSTIL
jgi:hypothetical protein